MLRIAALAQWAWTRRSRVVVAFGAALLLNGCGSARHEPGSAVAVDPTPAKTSTKSPSKSDGDFHWTERRVVDKFVVRSTVKTLADLMRRVHDATGSYPTAAIDFRQDVSDLGATSAELRAAAALYVARPSGSGVCLEIYGRSNHLVYFDIATNTLSTEISCEDGL
jgi:hypothetical protein